MHKLETKWMAKQRTTFSADVWPTCRHRDRKSWESSLPLHSQVWWRQKLCFSDNQFHGNFLCWKHYKLKHFGMHIEQRHKTNKKKFILLGLSSMSVTVCQWTKFTDKEIHRSKLLENFTWTFISKWIKKPWSKQVRSLIIPVFLQN